MKFTFWILSAYSITVISCTEIKSLSLSAARIQANEVDKCPKDNSFPVCGTNGVENLLFGNECLLKEAGEKRGDFTRTSLKSCFKDCDLICLGYYDPICAFNAANNKTQTFNNKCEIVRDTCRTEIDWRYKKHGKCTRRIKKVKKVKVAPKPNTKRRLKPIPCPKIFNPVCAIYTGVKSTFINECLVNAENVKTGKDWRIFSQGICEEDYASVSKSPKRHVLRKRNLDLKEFENVFEVGEPVTYIRPPPIFHTQFIKNEDQFGMFNSAASNLRGYYENGPETKPEILVKTEQMFIGDYLRNANAKAQPQLGGPSGVRANQVPVDPLPIENFGLEEFLKSLPQRQMPNLYQTDSNNAGTAILSAQFPDKNPNESQAHTEDEAPNKVLNRDPNTFSSQHQIQDSNSGATDYQNEQPKEMLNPSPNTDLRALETLNGNQASSNVPDQFQNHSPLNFQTFTERQAQSNAPTHYQALIEDFRPPPPLLPPQLSTQNKMNAEICKLGTGQLCCSFQNKTRTFKNICELNLHIELSGEDWQLEYDGACKDCNFMCSTILKPLCVSMNGLQYTIRNECILNTAICKHKMRAWKIIKDGVCEEDVKKQYQKVIDKYETAAPGFPFTSNYREHESTTKLSVITTNTTPSAVMKPNGSNKKPKRPQNQSRAKPKTKKSERKGEKDVIFVLKQLKNEQKNKSNENSKNVNPIEVKNSENHENFSTTPKSLGNKTKDKPRKNVRNKTKTQLRKAKPTEKRVSMYGVHGDSVMTTLLKALEDSASKLLPNIEQESKT